IDGRIITDGWPVSAEERKHYEDVHATYKPDGWIVGRVTMERHFAKGARSEEEISREHRGPPREDFVAPGSHDSFAIAVDPRGKLVWESGDLDGDHLIAFLSDRVANEYLEKLRQAGVSYLLAGSDDIDLPLALDKLH